MSDPEAFPVAVDLVGVRLRRARVGIVLGGLLGVMAGVALFAVPADGDALTVPGVALHVVAVAFLGAAIGSIIGGGRLQQIVTSTVGLDVASERIKNAVRGTETDLPRTERPRAIRFATISSLVLPAQIRMWGLFAAGSALGDVARFVSDLQLQRDDTPVLTLIVGLIPSAGFALLAVQSIWAHRRATSYLDEESDATRPAP